MINFIYISNVISSCSSLFSVFTVSVPLEELKRYIYTYQCMFGYSNIKLLIERCDNFSQVCLDDRIFIAR